MPVATFAAMSLIELVAARAAQKSDDPAVHTGAAEFGDGLQTLTYSDLQRAVDRLAAHYASLNLQPPTPAGEIPPERVIAVLTSTAIDETLLEIALAKLGLTGLLLSVNNSVAAVAHLCKQTKSSHLLYGTKFEKTAQEAQAALKEEGIEIEILPEKRFPLWGKGGVRDSKIPAYPARLTPQQETKRTCVILHSSGSTGFPKPVYITHYGLIANAALSIPGTGFSALPLFHGFGHFSIFRCVYHGKAFTLLPPHLPITSGNIVRTIKASPSPPQQHFAVPYVLKLLAETQEGIDCLASFEAVSFAGAAVPDDLGDRLVEAGVPLISFYGTTETGGLMTSRRDCKADKGWNWLRAEGSIADYLELAPQGSDTFEIIVKDGWPAKILSNREDGAYCTKDLMQRHPEHPTWFKYIGRLDDTLTQTLGEKTNPVPIELAIRGNSPLVRECIVFGDARPQVGCLILPSDKGAELSKDKKAFIEAVWPVIADANAAAPSHSRILPEMVELLPYGTDIPVATKMSILRPACYKLFAPIINSIYDRFEKGTGAPKQDISDPSEMQQFLHNLISTALGDKASADLTPTTDLFSYGVDSLQATRVRNDIIKNLELGDVTLGQNVVYEHPSIERLAKFILGLKEGSEAAASETAQEKMLAMLEKMSARLINSTSSPSSSNGHTGETIILTGATGSLGAHILDQLTRRPEVTRVICLSRAKSHADSTKRIQDSLAQRLRHLSPDAQAKIVSYAADVNRPDLGLSSAEYEDLRTCTTSIIHNAWPVNFVLSIDSFEEHVGGAVNLINLSLTSPHATKPTFFFSSSVGTRQGRPDPIVAEDFPDAPITAGGMGYGQSKWVVEKLCERAARDKGARVGVLRIGQLVGDSENGVWNETEAWPLLFRSAITTGVLPMLDEKPTWLPVDEAGSAIAEIVLSGGEEKAAVYHVLNNKESKWRDILAGLKKGGVKFETVDRMEWLDKLAKSEPDVERNPTYKLLLDQATSALFPSHLLPPFTVLPMSSCRFFYAFPPLNQADSQTFYQNRMGKTDERPHMEFLVDKTSAVSPTIRQVTPVSPELVALWVGQWRKSGFLQ